MEYAYRNPSETTTTGQIASITIGTNGASRSYTYSYDANGNITSVTEGNNATTYTYDNAGQLLRENNQAAGKTWVWEYDDAGNIESRTEYAYTTGNLGAVLDTVEYQYNNDNWGDLLTSYDGNTITYDQIGNPLNDGTWEYTWEHGRQLASMTDGTVTIDYEYNADGIRTRKTVITASDHSHIFQARVVAPTCTENGYTLHECSCGYSWQSNPVVATGHSFTTTEVEATCTAHGYTLMECECGYGYQEGSQGHTFTDTVVAPTAEENGYTLHSCECGYSYQDTPVAALGITNPTANGAAANTVVYDYVYNGSSLSYLTVTTNQIGQESTTDTLYFGNGTVTYNGTVYYYVTNLQGDVVAIIDADGNVKVEYTYDAWGKILSISGPMADTLGTVNPLTYRGYVYDAETDLYYLQSRYYDPAVSRFINGDALVSAGSLLGNNIFAYCGNEPISRVDPTGTVFKDASLWDPTHPYGVVTRDYVIYYYHPESQQNLDQNAMKNHSSENTYFVSVKSFDELVFALNNTPERIGDIYIYMHGDKTFLSFYEDLNFDAEAIKASINQIYITGDIYLFACKAGRGSIAYTLAEATNCTVVACKYKVSFDEGAARCGWENYILTSLYHQFVGWYYYHPDGTKDIYSIFYVYTK